MKTYKYDLVVVGGGPAGAIAARTASENGAKTLLLERDPHIGAPVRCGEAVNIENITRFIEIEKRAIAVEIEGMVLHAPDGSSVAVSSEGQLGAVLDRYLFDKHLAESAVKAGVDIITRADVEDLLFKDDKVNGVYYRYFGEKIEVESQMTIGADGVDSRVGRWAGLKTQIPSRDLESAYQKVITGIDFDNKYCHFYLGNDLVPGGYIWVFPKGEKTANVGIGVKVHLCNAGEAYQKLDEFIKIHFGNPSVIGEMAGGVPVGLPVKKPYTHGLLLAGDAARHCNPLTGGGIYTGMLSGYYAGQVASEAVKREDTSENFLKVIDNRIQKEITTVHKRAYKLADAVSKLSDETLNRTARDVLAIPEGKRTLKNIFLKGLISQPKLAVEIIKAFV